MERADLRALMAATIAGSLLHNGYDDVGRGDHARVIASTATWYADAILAITHPKAERDG